MTDNTRYLPALGRILIGGIFAMSGLTKIPAYAATTAMIKAAGLPLAPLGAAVAVAVETGLGLLLLGWRVARSQPRSRSGASSRPCSSAGTSPTRT